MNGIVSLVRQTIADLLGVQNAMQASTIRKGSTSPSEDEALSAELVAELKDTIDRTRLFLWRCSAYGDCQNQRDQAPAGKDKHRLQLASEFLWLLSRQSAPDGSTAEENMSFFERIDSISDRLLAEHPENKSSSKAA